MVLASHSTRACYLLACFCALAWHNRRAVHDWLESGSTLGESNNSSRAARKIKMHISYEGTAGTVSPPVHIRHIPHVGGKFALVCFRQPIGLAQLYHVCVMSSSALVLFSPCQSGRRLSARFCLVCIRAEVSCICTLPPVTLRKEGGCLRIRAIKRNWKSIFLFFLFLLFSS